MITESDLDENNKFYVSGYLDFTNLFTVTSEFENHCTISHYEFSMNNGHTYLRINDLAKEYDFIKIDQTCVDVIKCDKKRIKIVSENESVIISNFKISAINNDGIRKETRASRKI